MRPGGNQEEHATRFIAEMTKPVIVFISGKTAPAEKRMGHAGAVSSKGGGVAADKVKALEVAGVRMADTLNDISASRPRRSRPEASDRRAGSGAVRRFQDLPFPSWR